MLYVLYIYIYTLTCILKHYSGKEGTLASLGGLHEMWPSTPHNISTYCNPYPKTPGYGRRKGNRNTNPSTKLFITKKKGW